MADRRSSRSHATLGSPITMVGRRPVHTVTNAPYVSVHFLNAYHGFTAGRSHLFPKKGTGEGPGGLYLRNVRKTRVLAMATGRRLT